MAENFPYGLPGIALKNRLHGGVKWLEYELKWLVLDAICASAKCIYMDAMQILTQANKDGSLQYDISIKSEKNRKNLK